MNNASDTYKATDRPFPKFTKTIVTEEDDHLREILRRCSPATYEAARKFRATDDVREIPTIILGVIERFTESGLRPKLRDAHDNLILTEDLGLDSLTLMEMVMIVEDVLSISIKNEELRTLRTIGDIKNFIAVKVSDRNRPRERTA